MTRALLRKPGPEVDLVFRYGSTLKGTTHPYSDLDVSYVPAHESTGDSITVLVADVLIDLYPIRWSQLEKMADFENASASVLLESQLIYQRNEAVGERFHTLACRLKSNLEPPAQPRMLKKAQELFQRMQCSIATAWPWNGWRSHSGACYPGLRGAQSTVSRWQPRVRGTKPRASAKVDRAVSGGARPAASSGGRTGPRPASDSLPSRRLDGSAGRASRGRDGRQCLHSTEVRPDGRGTECGRRKTSPVGGSTGFQGVHDRALAGAFRGGSGEVGGRLEALREEDFRRPWRHYRLGLVTLDHLLQQYAWHARHHTAHITNLRARMGW